METSLPVLQPQTTRCGTPRKSRRSIFRAASLIAVHVLVLIHIAHWKTTGQTLTPLEPSEAMQTLELGYVNAGFLLFAAAILATMLLGRFFCGWACHVVAYQDLCAWILKRLGLKPRPVRSRLLVLVPLGAALYMFVWPQVERLWAGTHFPEMSLHLTTDSFWQTFPGPWVAALTILVDGFLIVWFLGAKGFCTYGCPYGAFFGAADRLALGKIRVTDACEGCGHCTATCTSNVDVRKEVNLHGMVVDPGCMKCMDCVSVCPKGALYFGFGATSLFGRKEKAKIRKVYDFSPTEEIALAAVFLLALLAFRGLYGKVPFLLAIGLGVIAAVGVFALRRLLREPGFALQHHTLRREGRFTPAGIAALSLLGGFLLLTAHSGLVRYHAWRGEALIEAAERMPREERGPTLGGSLAHLLAAERLGLVATGGGQNMIGAIYREQGDLEAAERHYRRAVELEPGFQAPRRALAALLHKKGDLEGAERVLKGKP